MTVLISTLFKLQINLIFLIKGVWRNKYCDNDQKKKKKITHCDRSVQRFTKKGPHDRKFDGGVLLCRISSVAATSRL